MNLNFAAFLRARCDVLLGSRLRENDRDKFSCTGNQRSHFFAGVLAQSRANVILRMNDRVTRS